MKATYTINGTKLYNCIGSNKISKCIISQISDMTVMLYDQTPRHAGISDLVERIFDGTLFQRVIKEFMIQGGAQDKQCSSRS